MDDPKIHDIADKNLVGTRISTSLSENRASELWRAFLPKMQNVRHRVGTDRYSLKIYAPNYSFIKFDPMARYEKWAAVEVSEILNVPDDLEPFILKGGRYAVFIHRGTPARAPETFGYIFGTWIPNSDFELDARPHFEVLGENYSPFDNDAEEEVWIPIRSRI